jgi:hypothetical protein
MPFPKKQQTFNKQGGLHHEETNRSGFRHRSVARCVDLRHSINGNGRDDILLGRLSSRRVRLDNTMQM